MDNVLQVLTLYVDQNEYENIIPLYESVDYVKEYFDTPDMVSKWGGTSFYNGYYLRKFKDYDLSKGYAIFKDELVKLTSPQRTLEFIRYYTYFLLTDNNFLSIGYYQVVVDLLNKLNHINELRILVHVILTRVTTSYANDDDMNINLSMSDQHNSIHYALIEHDLIPWLTSTCDRRDIKDILVRYLNSKQSTEVGAINVINYIKQNKYFSDRSNEIFEMLILGKNQLLVMMTYN